MKARSRTGLKSELLDFQPEWGGLVVFVGFWWFPGGSLRLFVIGACAMPEPLAQSGVPGDRVSALTRNCALIWTVVPFEPCSLSPLIQSQANAGAGTDHFFFASAQNLCHTSSRKIITALLEIVPPSFHFENICKKHRSEMLVQCSSIAQ